MQIDAARGSADAQHIVADIGLVGSVALAATSVVLYLTREALPRTLPLFPAALAPSAGGFTIRF
jgi:hypothetical protein